MFELRDGWLFYGLDGLLYVARYDSRTFPDCWEVFEARIEWWHGVYLDGEED